MKSQLRVKLNCRDIISDMAVLVPATQCPVDLDLDMSSPGMWNVELMKFLYLLYRLSAKETTGQIKNQKQCKSTTIAAVKKTKPIPSSDLGIPEICIRISSHFLSIMHYIPASQVVLRK